MALQEKYFSQNRIGLTFQRYRSQHSIKKCDQQVLKINQILDGKDALVKLCPFE
jgi:hypothetical protein